MKNVLAVGPKPITRRVSASVANAATMVVTACSSRRALARLVRERKFHLAIAEWQSAGREGIAILSHLRIPVILIASPKRLAEAYRLAKSVEVVLETPINNQELAALAIALANGEKAAKQPDAAMQPSTAIGRGAGQ
jgi:CheY-like chemotaxis protein